jgi:predicted enzyme involved in methoxymalonyl-ACP biosynthesis
MSCRIIGRNIEHAFMNHLMAYFRKHDVCRVDARYVATAKNAQVKDLFDRCSFVLSRSTDTERHYSLDTIAYVPKQVDYVEISDGRSD